MSKDKETDKERKHQAKSAKFERYQTLFKNSSLRKKNSHFLHLEQKQLLKEVSSLIPVLKEMSEED